VTLAALTIAMLFAQQSAATTDAACTACVTVPALTPVQIELRASLSSEKSKGGESFPIHLATPLMIDGREVIRAGATGIGEVVHAQKATHSGVPGELILAARHLDISGRRMKLRSLRTRKTGKPGFNVPSWPRGVWIYPPTDGRLFIEEGTVAEARTAEAFTIAPPPFQTAAEGGAPSAATLPAKGHDQP